MIKLNSKEKPIAIALGYFDSVHYAHRKIIGDVVDYAEKNGLKSAVFTFSNELYSKSNGFPVYLFRERKKLLSEMGVNYIVPYCFDEQFRQTEKEEFLDMLFSSYDIRFVACGDDYRFGHNGAGDTEFLKEYCAARGVAYKIYPPIELDGRRVSTTLIKEKLADGEIKTANKLLCRPYFIEGKVTRGRGRGHGLGFPTANLKPTEKFLPKFGVYKSRAFVDGQVFPSVTNIGGKPTFADEAFAVETFIIGDVNNLYGKIIRVELIDYLREIRRFDSPDELRAQIQKDTEAALC